MRRKPGTLVPLEQALCAAGAALRRRGVVSFHGYLLAKEVKASSDARRLTAYGTLYRALARLEQMGLMTSQWEDPQVAADEERPRRRLYSLTDTGLRAAAETSDRSTHVRRRGKLAEA